MNWQPTVQNCDNYMDERQGKYDYRAVRYREAIKRMYEHGLDDTMTVVDVGAGMTEFDYCLRVEFNWRGRYIPVDGGIDGTDIRTWIPRSAHWFVGLEILEHIEDWRVVSDRMQAASTKGVIVSTPDPQHTDVLAMDPTHVVGIDRMDLEHQGYMVTNERFYGGTYGESVFGNDALMGVWTR